MIVLETPRLYLRRFTAEDAPLLHELDSDPEVMRYISNGRPTPLEKIVRDQLPQWLAWYDVGENVGYWAAHERESDAFIGWFMLRPDRLLLDAMELGYRLRRADWGKGFATEGAAALVQRGFQDAAIPHITATTLIGNRASQRVMEKVGLRFEMHFVYPAEWLPGWTEAERRAVRYGVRRWERETVRLSQE